MERRSTAIPPDASEHEHLEARATVAGVTIPQYIRTQCGFLARNTSLPGTGERDREEDDAWERLCFNLRPHCPGTARYRCASLLPVEEANRQE